MNWAQILLSDPSPCLRYQVLRDLLSSPADDPEVLEVAENRVEDPIFTSIKNLQDGDGSWKTGMPGESFGRDRLQATGLILARLGFLGFNQEYPFVQAAADYLFSQQQADGSWPLSMDGIEEEGEGYSMQPLQTAFPLRGLSACGYAQDARCERAYEWLLAQRLADGAWPTGLAAGGIYGYVAGYRRMAHSRWGCRSNTTGAVICLAQHPDRRSSDEARRALDLLLGRETKERASVGFETCRLIGAEPSRGFISYFARYDLALILKLCWRIGATLEDQRVEAMVEFVRQNQGVFGLWEYQPKPQASRWVTFDLLRTLSGLDENSQQDTGWLSLEPRTPFQPYPSRRKRY
jgi:hypothetical protein